MKTEIIRYNLLERGRKHRGVERRFDVDAIVKAVNSKETQERVTNRDMHGFYGHWARIKFGMMPEEGAIVAGKTVHIEPAIVTTLLKAHPDGTIEHQAEFLKTQSGELAWKLYTSKTGGFSSAIDTQKPEFFGFDYVLEPNYTTNRGYTFDSVCEGGLCGALMPDEIDKAVYDEQMAGMLKLLEGMESFKNYALDAIESLNKQQQQVVIESVKVKNKPEFIRPKMIPIGGHKKAVLDSAARFMADADVEQAMKRLVTQQRMAAPKLAEKEAHPVVDMMLSKFKA